MGGHADEVARPDDKLAPTFTVFTATFNRAHTLPRVYESLKAQTFRDFEWVVVDDGSSDGTSDLVGQWLSEGALDIRYVYQENSGKHVAFNRGVRLARGSLFASLDSDDEAKPDALKDLHDEWLKIPFKERDRYSGVLGLCVDDEGRLVGDRFPTSPLDCLGLELRFIYKVKGEKWGFVRTDVFRRFPFPETPGVYFVPEGVVHGKINSLYYKRAINKVIYTYWIKRGAGDQLTKNRNPFIHSTSHAFWHSEILNNQISWLKHHPIYFIRSAVHYVRFNLCSGVGVRAQASGLRKPSAKALWLVVLPAGFLVFLIDILRNHQR